MILALFCLALFLVLCPRVLVRLAFLSVIVVFIALVIGPPPA